MTDAREKYSEVFEIIARKRARAIREGRMSEDGKWLFPYKQDKWMDDNLHYGELHDTPTMGDLK